LALVELLQHLGGVLGNLRAAHRRSDIITAHVAAVIPFITPFVSLVTFLWLLGPGNYHRACHILLDVDQVAWLVVVHLLVGLTQNQRLSCVL